MHDPAPATPENAVPDAGLARWHLRLLGAVELVDARGHISRLPSRAATACKPCFTLNKQFLV